MHQSSLGFSLLYKIEIHDYISQLYSVPFTDNMAGDTVNNWFEYYRYDPSMAAAVIFIVLFFITTILHFYQLVRTKTWIVIPLLVGGICTLLHSRDNGIGTS